MLRHPGIALANASQRDPERGTCLSTQESCFAAYSCATSGQIGGYNRTFYAQYLPSALKSVCYNFALLLAF